MIRAAFVLLIASVALAAPSEPKQQPENLALPAPVELKEGHYLCYAMEGDQIAYECTVTVRRPRPACTVVVWSNGYQGVGMRSGDAVSIGWRSVRAETVGVCVVSPADKEGKTWTAKQLHLPGSGEVSTETWEYLRALKSQEP